MKHRYIVLFFALLLALAYVAAAEECVCSEKKFTSCNPKTGTTTWARICTPSECDVESGTIPCATEEQKQVVNSEVKSNETKSADLPLEGNSNTQPINYTIVWVLGISIFILMILISIVIVALKKLE